MIYGKLSDFENMGLVALGETVMHSVAWIRSLPASPTEGWYSLGAKDLNALVLSYETGPAEESRFETHRRFVDLQYTLAGSEIIEWAPRETLTNDGEYDEKKDLLFHHPGSALGSFVKPAGFFSIYTQVDAHRCRIRAAGFDSVSKLVIKIPVDRFPAV